MRLLEELKTSEIWNYFGPRLRDYLGRTQFIVADDVTQYFFAINDKEHWDVEDFPNLAPPFDNFWVETKHPTHILSEEYGVSSWHNPEADRPERWGALFVQAPKERLLEEPDSAIGQRIGFFKPEDLPLFKWLYEIVLFVQYPNSEISPTWAWSLPICEEGNIFEKHDEVTRSKITGYSYSIHEGVRYRLMQPGGVALYQSLRASSHTMLNPLLLSICFMHCKNVELQTVNPPEKLKKRNAQRGRPMLTYRTVQVNSIRKIIEASRKPGDSDITMALNRCRGHFKTYTAERPLLGRAVGKYFWAEQLRGHKKKGLSLHDYKVTTPKG